MLQINYTPSFIRSYKLLNDYLKTEVKDKIEAFRNTKNHKSLKVHKLHGRFKGKCSFYVNYKFRVLFKYLDSKEVVLIDADDHDIYK